MKRNINKNQLLQLLHHLTINHQYQKKTTTNNNHHHPQLERKPKENIIKTVERVAKRSEANEVQTKGNTKENSRSSSRSYSEVSEANEVQTSE